MPETSPKLTSRRTQTASSKLLVCESLRRRKQQAGVARLLRQFGYASLLFSSAEAFANHSDFEEAVCVLLDVNLGDVSGIELRLRLKAAGSSVPVIYMTGNDSPAVRTAALQSGCLAYLTKPFSAKSLREPLDEIASAA